ncbi:MAG: PAN domain-containing protein [Chloroflexota bacterium]
MSDNNDEKKVSFWHTMPGCITAIGGLVSVIVAAVVALSAAGFIQPPFMPTATPSSVSDSNSSIESVPVATNINNPLVISTAPPTSTLTQVPQNPPASTINWIIDSTGVCRDDSGGYPRWSAYDWTLSQCEQACQNNPNCQGFAMSKERNYCQLFGSDGNNAASNPGAQITRGDETQPGFACYLKSADQSSISMWTMDSTGVCRDDSGGYPRWSAYDWTLSQCEQACQNNPNCQGFAMSKERNYCQLFGSDGSNTASNDSAQITRGDKSQPGFVCYIKR